MPGDTVVYQGEKFAKELHGKPGVVCARISGTKTGYVVDFGSHSFVMDQVHLSRFNGKVQVDPVQERQKESKFKDEASGGVEIRRTRKRKPVQDTVK